MYMYRERDTHTYTYILYHIIECHTISYYIILYSPFVPLLWDSEVPLVMSQAVVCVPS